ncbi:adenylate/guanylate cyclase domain-containing protein [Nostoc sp. CENA67]|uniref:Adenylate/guanylate cyclase domain-containing protein n=1 Tax=Amazonocrinis nigriterrae CENA67 TaxID=2794033 RepID=A0A8J7HVC4_9NOST|nr:adenylate/guanylate cyclase domain-containing protein [Amazonocrinis nigriterrae]MBH8566668.1 adenylate/guanylate cyclase domain-containing protein [Amazonocrinis nigriterrae CENA67]
MKKTVTVVELDLVGYGNLVKKGEEEYGVDIVPRLNQQIQGFIDGGLNKVNQKREEVVIARNGDNAVILFEDANDAYRFAEAVHQATQLHNANKTEPSAKRWFRIGAATGEITEDNGRVTGYVIVKAYRLEASAKLGEFVVDSDTYQALDFELQQKYGIEETLNGKYDESFRVRRCKMISDSNLTTTEPTVRTELTPKGVSNLFYQLNPPDQNQYLMTFIGMPQEHRPSNDLTIFDKRGKILDWAVNNNKLQELQDALLELIQRQPRP